MSKCTIKLTTPYNSPVFEEEEFDDCRSAILWAQEQCKNRGQEYPYIESVFISDGNDFEMSFIPDEYGVSGTITVTVGGHIKHDWSDHTDDFCSVPIAQILHNDRKSFIDFCTEIEPVFCDAENMKKLFVLTSNHEYDNIISFVKYIDDWEIVVEPAIKKFYGNFTMMDDILMMAARRIFGGYYRRDFDNCEPVSDDTNTGYEVDF